MCHVYCHGHTHAQLVRHRPVRATYEWFLQWFLQQAHYFQDSSTKSIPQVPAENAVHHPLNLSKFFLRRIVFLLRLQINLCWWFSRDLEWIWLDLPSLLHDLWPPGTASSLPSHLVYRLQIFQTWEQFEHIHHDDPTVVLSTPPNIHEVWGVCSRLELVALVSFHRYHNRRKQIISGKPDIHDHMWLWRETTDDNFVTIDRTRITRTNKHWHMDQVDCVNFPLHIMLLKLLF